MLITRASGGYNGGRRCAFLHNRLLWISVRLSGCFGAANGLPGIQGEIWRHATNGKRLINLRSSLMLSYSQKKTNIQLIMIAENETDKLKKLIII